MFLVEQTNFWRKVWGFVLQGVVWYVEFGEEYKKNSTFLQSIGSNYKFYGDEPQLGVDEFIKAYW